MQTRQLLIVSIVFLVSAVAMAAQQRGGGGQRAGAPAAPPMTMSVAGFPDGGQIPVKFSQAAEGAAPGEGTSPAITWTMRVSQRRDDKGVTPVITARRAGHKPN